jgi:peptidoglycan/LPS O-acetylase OafA/YrhL
VRHGVGGTVGARGGYMPQLDGLRCFAVLAVLVWHAWRPGPLPLFGDVSWGGLGIQLFFVLSGFLITGILLDCRERSDSGDGSRMFFIRRFYGRRFLRIFPLYYGLLLLLLAANFLRTRELAVWLFTYTTNVFIAGHGWIGALGHFWTLAVEEQFYLVWPWLLLFLSRRRLRALIVLVIAAAPLYRLYAFHRYGVAQDTRMTFTLAVVDSLGVGALIALLARSGSVERLRSFLLRVVLPVGLGAYLALIALQHEGVGAEAAYVGGATAVAAFFGSVVVGAAIGFGGIAGDVLSFRPVAYVGKISYGVYVFHPLVMVALTKAAPRLGLVYESRGVVSFVVATSVSIGVASLSWHLYERPINDLKKRVPYRGGRARRAPLPASAPGAADS